MQKYILKMFKYSVAEYQIFDIYTLTEYSVFGDILV